MESSIIVAAKTVVQHLVVGEKSNKEILQIWDELRGSDKFENYVSKSDILKLVNKGEPDVT